ncbi:MAG: STAS domain-containing protein [Betaproteobacteria bacterium]
MALFSKPPAKKPRPPVPEARPVPPAPSRPSARDLTARGQGRKREPERALDEPAGGDITVTGASMIELAPAHPAGFEVAHANPGLCAVLENAALLYAGGQTAPARVLLEQGVASDHDTRLSPLAWLALFDLLQRARDHSAFDQLSLQYVVQFERTAPAWEEPDKPQATKAQGGYVAISGKLTAASAPQVDGLRRAIDKGATHTRIDLSQVAGYDDDGARLLALALAAARKRAIPMSLQRPEKLRVALAAALKEGAEAGEGAWLLALELLQWTQDRDAFENLAVDYAVTFELSPPSWEPPPPSAPAADATLAGADTAAGAPADADMLKWTGVMAGSALPHFIALSDFAQGRAIVPIDMSGVERVDFVCAGALLNAINRIEQQRKAVQVLGVSPIVRAMLLLIGISPRHFLKKAQ